MNYKDVDINPADDHMEKWNRSDNELKNANDKLKNISKRINEKIDAQRNEDSRENTILKDYAGGKIRVIPKNKNEIKNIWNAFLQIEPEYKKYMQYGKDTIKKLGIREFIEYMGWDKPIDVEKWRSNILHVIPCAHCKQYFTTVEQDYGLCPKCKEEYEMDRFLSMVTANEQANPGSSSAIRAMFIYDPEFRSKYIKKTTEQRIIGCATENFKGLDTFRILKDLLTEKEGDIDEVREEIYALICGRKDYELCVEHLDSVFDILRNSESLEEQIETLGDIFLKEEDK